MSVESPFPTFFIPGAAKAGTSSLHEMLAQHPDVTMSTPKEPHVFSRSLSAPAAEAAYQRLFRGSARSQRGESSTTYLVSERALDNIARTLPGARFICLLRNPVERLLSHYNWMRSLGTEWRPLRAAALADRDRPFDIRHHYGGNYRYYFAFSSYGAQLERLVDRFGRDAILVATTEQFRQDPHAVLGECFRFLGVAPFESLVPVWQNRTSAPPWHPVKALMWSSTYKIPRLGRGRVGGLLRHGLRRLPSSNAAAQHARVDERDRSWLAAELREDGLRLRAALGRDFPEWATPT
jgi:hypothetical protein